MREFFTGFLALGVVGFCLLMIVILSDYIEAVASTVAVFFFLLILFGITKCTGEMLCSNGWCL